MSGPLWEQRLNSQLLFFFDEISLGERLLLHGYLNAVTASQLFDSANDLFVWIRDDRKHDDDWDSDSEPPPLVTDSDAD